MAINEKISAGAVAANAQVARDPGAVTQNPTVTVTSTGQRLAEAGITTGDTGTNAPTVTLAQSQATPTVTLSELVLESPPAPSQAGVGARGEDGAPVTGNTTKDIINATFKTNQYIPTQPNVLDDYASYTYQISWYLLTPQQYNNLVFSPKFNVASWSLLMQSGGAPLPLAGPVTTDYTLGSRNPYFDVDYYLDDLELFSKFPGKGTGMPHNVLDIKFKVIEPNGLTLINKLHAAVKAIYGVSVEAKSPVSASSSDLVEQLGEEAAKNLPPSSKAGTPSYLTAHYCLGIKFYGYDDEGNLIAPATGKFDTNSQNNGDAPVGSSNDPGVIIEKYYPFLIKDIKFRVVSRQVEYSVEAAPPSHFNAFGQARGTIPYNFELSGTTVKDLLIGQAAQSGLQPQQDGRVTQSTPPGKKIPTAPSAAIAAGTDPNAVNDQGMAFGGGGL